MKALLLMSVLLAFTPALIAGDGNPFPPGQVVIRFESRNPESNAKVANVVMDIQWPEDGKLHELDGAHYYLISIQAGGMRLDVPQAILKDMSNVDLNSVKLEWGVHQYHLSFQCKIGEETGKAVFVFEAKDAKHYLFSRASIGDTNLDKLYPALFKPAQ